MKNFIVIGNPIDQSLSPDLHNWIFKKLKINAFYNKILCNEIDIISQIKNDKINGINVTLPFKETIINFVDEINLRVKSIGSVNCIVKNKNKLIGYNTDWYGFSKLINNNKVDIQNKEVIVIGAGGVSRAVIFSLIQMRVKKINDSSTEVVYTWNGFLGGSFPSYALTKAWTTQGKEMITRIRKEKERRKRLKRKVQTKIKVGSLMIKRRNTMN